MFRASFTSALNDQKEGILSDILCFIIQALRSVFMDFIHIYPLCKIIFAVCLSLRDYVAVCLHSVGIAHVFKYRLNFSHS